MDNTPRERFRSGLDVGTGLAAASFLLATSFGAVTQAQGWGTLAPVLCSMVVFSGSAQFALVAGLSAGGGVAAAVTAAALVNSRFLPMGMAVAADLRGGRLRRALEGQAVVDGSWAAAHLGGGRFDRYVLFGATVVQWPAWVAGTALGVAVAPDPELLRTLGLDVLTPALFVMLLIDELRKERANRLPALLGAVIAAGLVLVLPPGPALVGAAAAALVALVRPADAHGDSASDSGSGSASEAASDSEAACESEAASESGSVEVTR
ncbi:AzlC family ABC transporter permease [Streptomyces sp. NPDC015130]|uniref:AzlC family ABC transporter permease n=1 Tax=Streptomyces sp. NPDC015130 TaxID=3364940 RepID=UPI0036F5FB77